MSCISTPSPAASRRSNTLPTTCARSSAGRHLPGYELVIERSPHGAERLNFTPIPVDPIAERLRKRGPRPPGEKL